MMGRIITARGILRMHLKRTLQYRLVAWAQLSTNIFWGFVHTVIIAVFYRYGEQTAGASSGMSMAQAVSYVWLGQIVLYLLPTFGSDAEIREKIRNGDVGVELCRPLDLYFHWYWRTAASRLGRFLLQVFPVVAVAMLIPAPYRLLPPASLPGFMTAICSLAISLLFSCALVSLTYVLAMNIQWGDGPITIFVIVVDILAGSYLPLQLWPSWAQRWLFYQPFAGLQDLPLRLYLGTLPPGAFPRVALLQLAWTAVFTAVGWLLMQRSLRRLVVQGG
ncbi:MAG: ABC transporter permease [Bacillota bacterium]|jgi:ABC-2 type transport system permease protein